MQTAIFDRIDDIDAGQWNALIAGRHPFLRHEFLAALEHHGCVGERFGWLPQHVAVTEGDRLVAAMPMYAKNNSYGELVFDQPWAQAYQRAGLPYYPKLVAAVPYTPVTGQRLLTVPGREDELRAALLRGAVMHARDIDASGFHCLFPVAGELDWLAGHKLLVRHDCQFHWQNRGYGDFDDFLSGLAGKKRKNIRQQRRRVAESGVVLHRLDGSSAGAEHWRVFSEFYRRTFDEKGGWATLNEGFFREVANAMPDQVLLVMAELGGEWIAGALMFRSDTHLYGRHWGSVEVVDHLHFEACYYQGIEYCIEKGLAVFEPGAQGEHKLARGFLPVRTRSAHYLEHGDFRTAIADWVQQERVSVDHYIAGLDARQPYSDGAEQA